jgi:hypothetical protein
MYTIEQLERMLKKEKEYLKDLRLDVKISEMEVSHLEDCIRVLKERKKG